MNQNTFTDFLYLTPSQKEVSVVIAKDDSELKELKNTLDSQGFMQLADSPELLRYVSAPSKVYFLVHSNLPKRIYDFLIQYPTGQIEIFDKNQMKSSLIKPVYKDVSVLLLLTKEQLINIQKGGYQILEHTGLAYQS